RGIARRTRIRSPVPDRRSRDGVRPCGCLRRGRALVDALRATRIGILRRTEDRVHAIYRRRRREVGRRRWRHAEPVVDHWPAPVDARTATTANVAKKIL